MGGKCQCCGSTVDLLCPNHAEESYAEERDTLTAENEGLLGAVSPAFYDIHGKLRTDLCNSAYCDGAFVADQCTCWVADARAALLGDSFVRPGDKVISPGCTPVGEVLRTHTERGALVQWPSSGGEYVRPCWYKHGSLAKAREA